MTALHNNLRRCPGFGLLINTSFNVRGEPIVCSPFDAFRCFMSTDIDYLVINNFVYSKKEQKEFKNKAKWQIKNTGFSELGIKNHDKLFFRPHRIILFDIIVLNNFQFSCHY